MVKKKCYSKMMGEDVTLEFIEVEMWMKIGMSGCDPLGGFAGFR